MKHIRTTLLFVVLASLAMTATATQTRKNKTAPKPKSSSELALKEPAGDLGSMVGTWTLRDGDKPLGHIRMVFRSNGTFAFVGPNWQSTGKFKVQDHKLALEWTSVDGEKIAPGVMKKDFAMAEDESSFTIDKYTYYKRQ